MADPPPHDSKIHAQSGGVGRSLWSLPLLPLQPLLSYIIAQVAKQNPGVFARLGEHKDTLFVIDPVDLPFVLMLAPNPERLKLRAVPRGEEPAAGARISGKFLHLVRLVDCDEDGDAMFFSRELTVTGNTEAVVRLRNALDDVDGSLAAIVAGLLGPPGRAALSLLRRAGGWQPRVQGEAR